MPEWSTYRLEDLALFPPRAWYRLVEAYNRGIWPLQLVAIVAAIAIVALVFVRSERWRGRLVAAILATAWLWVAWGFHLERYASIHWAAKWFAAGFALEALLLVALGVVAGKLEFDGLDGTPKAAGIVVASFALLLHPLVAPSLGRSWQAAELFGVMPDPTAVATLGILLLASNRAHWTLQAIPVAWCVISGATLLTIDAPDALTAPLLAVATVPFAVAKQMTARRALRAGPGSPQPLAGP